MAMIHWPYMYSPKVVGSDAGCFSDVTLEILLVVAQASKAFFSDALLASTTNSSQHGGQYSEGFNSIQG